MRENRRVLYLSHPWISYFCESGCTDLEEWQNQQDMRRVGLQACQDSQVGQPSLLQPHCLQKTSVVYGKRKGPGVARGRVCIHSALHEVIDTLAPKPNPDNTCCSFLVLLPWFFCCCSEEFQLMLQTASAMQFQDPEYYVNTYTGIPTQTPGRTQSLAPPAHSTSTASLIASMGKSWALD